jgi:hypothetical protein
MRSMSARSWSSPETKAIGQARTRRGKSGQQSLILVLDKLPRIVGIDPFNARIERDSNDNMSRVKLD